MKDKNKYRSHVPERLLLGLIFFGLGVVYIIFYYLLYGELPK